MKENFFWRDYIFFIEDAGKRGGARHASESGAKRQSNGNSNAAALVFFPSIVLLFVTSFKKEGAAWNESPSSNYTKICETLLPPTTLRG